MCKFKNPGMIYFCGVWQKKKFMGREYLGIMRASFLTNPTGTVVKIYEKVKPEEHATEVFADV